MKDRWVLVTTEYRGVFFGRLVEEEDRIAIIAEAQNCVYWSTEEHGFLGLAAKGPGESCKIGPPCKTLKLYGVTSIADCSAEAQKRWKAMPWS